MRSNNWLKHLVVAALLGVAGVSHAQFTAVNDHASGPGTGPNTTLYHMFGQEDGQSGFMRDLNTGADLPVTLTIIRSGFVAGVPYGASPAAGTPLYNAFDGLVDWANNANNNVGMSFGTVTYQISGLDPAKKYIVQGGAVIGRINEVNKWTIFALDGADDYVSAHSGGLDSGDQPAEIADNQVAINTGLNHLLNQGDMFEWQEIQPGADGTIEIVCSRYTGPIPGGGTANGSNGHALTALKLIEAVNEIPVILTQPETVVAQLGENVAFNVAVTGFPLAFQWYKDDVLIPGANSPRYSFTVSPLDVGSFFTVVISNNLGTVTSQGVTVVVLPPEFEVVPYNQVWRYDRSAANLGTSWRDNDFGDATWPSGPGPLGHPVGEATPVPIATVVATHNNITYYYRTTFVFDGEPTDFELVFTNFVDDGAVFYLNEEEVLRVEMPDAPAVIDFVTSAAVGGEFELREDIVPATVLVKGTNYLTVEVHQINTTSSDAILGLNIWARPLPPGPLSITADPQDLTVEELKEALFTVGVDGNGARFQWIKDGDDLPGATSATLKLSDTTVADSGEYSVRVSNAFSSLVSAVGVLTVMQDDTSPILVEADGSLYPTNILVLFSEKVTESLAVDVSNYRLTSSDMAMNLTITSLVYTNDGTAVLLTTQPRTEGQNYLLIVNNVTDVSPQANVIEEDSTVAVFTEIELVGWYSTWDFYDPFPPFDELDPGEGWETPAYAGFPGGASPLSGPYVYNAPANELPIAPNPIYATLSQGSITKYFRHTLNYEASLVGAQFRMQHMSDDGIIVYLNGEEFHRFNMPEGTADPLTTAAPPVGVATIVDVEDIPSEGLLNGDNLLAVELHGISEVDLDWVFAMSFKIRVKSFTTGPVVILKDPTDQTVIAGQNVTFTFDGIGPSAYQWMTNGVNVLGATGPTFTIVNVPLESDGILVSVRALNSTSSASTGQALLTVLDDIFPPLLVSGYASETRDSITISFDELIDPVTGGDIGNYTVTDGFGASFNVTSATVDGTDVLLETDAYDPLNQITVFVSNVQDLANVPNTILAESGITIGYESVLISRTDIWSYNDFGEDLFTAGQWTTLGYDDVGWPTGPGSFVARNANPGAEPLPPGWDFMTEMTYGTSGGLDYRTNFYFRKVVTVPGPLVGTVIASNLVDDGGVFYLNSQEIGRFRMSGTPTANTFAGSRGDIGTGADAWDVFEFDASLFLPGDNLVAATIHQTSNTSSDCVYNTEYFLRAEPILIPGLPATCEDPTIGFDAMTDEVVVTWTGACVLVQSDTVNGVYTVVAGASSPYRVLPSNMKFYQLRTP